MVRESRWHPPSAPVRRAWVVTALAGIGVAVAGYLAVTKLTGGTAMLCRGVAGCDVVQQSRYATFLGVPTAAWGALLYGAVGGLALAGLTPRRWLTAFLLAVAAVSFSAYLTYLELFVIGAVCWYCVVSAGVAGGLFGALLGRRPAGGWRWIRPVRVWTLAATTGVATVATGALVFALAAPWGDAAYAEALARHLESSGAVFYGAFW
jgi:uncharacterized membrane protein